MHGYQALRHRLDRAIDWKCSRFINAGGFAGLAGDVASLLRTLVLPRLQLPVTQSSHEKREHSCADDQCILTILYLNDAAPFALDTNELLFAYAVRALCVL